LAETKRREKEVMFRKIIAICSNVPLELIESVSFGTSHLISFVAGREMGGEGEDFATDFVFLRFDFSVCRCSIR